MAKLSINKLKPGMTTQVEVIDSHGHTLIRANETLSENHITLLKMWGIPEIDIKESSDELNLEQLKSIYPASSIDSLAIEADLKFKFFSVESELASFLKKLYIESSAKRSK